MLTQLIHVKISNREVRSTFLNGVDPLISYSIILLSDAVEPIMLVSTGLNFQTMYTINTPGKRSAREKKQFFSLLAITSPFHEIHLRSLMCLWIIDNLRLELCKVIIAI